MQAANSADCQEPLTFLDDGVADALQLLLLVLKLLNLSQLVGLKPVNDLHTDNGHNTMSANCS